MNKTLLALFVVIVIGLTGCSTRTSGDVIVYANEIKYVKDYRTNLCFAFLASRKAGHFNMSGMGMANVPCNDKVEKLLVKE